ncbi:uncharacterized protein BT62DRAFT_929419 [Guyanagaster necrorhizus]|uniref:DUF6535 domain-containing protein n=1 Tax=Guyanagaster necrorhizus TaxID=856835 RepID=A0A9P7W143_9AGAR|nr:uncharacterized protein BT62DRAFT_929419 [Guyanagaster necrorhizus MCA 3950]KAG7449456.1 hypothetical protein BT62DRAFT_929419 [Guyanagaster necrorhizus MCA 3950]
MDFQCCMHPPDASPSSSPMTEKNSSSPDIAVNTQDVALLLRPQPHVSLAQNVENHDSTGHDESVLKLYAKKAHLYDKARFELWHKRLDLQLLFAGIFSAIILPLIAETYTFLSEPGPPAYAIRINAFLAISLVISVMTAVFSLHCKQWMDGYDVDLLLRSDLSGDIQTLAKSCRIHQYRFQALERYHFPSIVGLGALFIYVAIVCFSIALVDFFWQLYRPIGVMLAGLSGMIISLHILTSIQPCLSSASPFKSPFSYLLVNLWLGALDGQLATDGKFEQWEHIVVEDLKQHLDGGIAHWATSDALQHPMGYP